MFKINLKKTSMVAASSCGFLKGTKGLFVSKWGLEQI
jgi:hypothetical protein